MVEVPLSWKLSVSGAEDVKAKLQDIQNQFNRGEVSSTEYAKGLREVNRDARTLTRQSDIQKNVFLAQYPAVNQLSRGLSAFNSVANAGVSIMNSLNLMFLRQGQDTTALAKLNSDIAETQRELNKAMMAGDWSKVEELKSKLQELTNVKDNMIKDIDNRKLQDWLTGFIGVSLAVGVATREIIKAIPYIQSIIGQLNGVRALLSLTTGAGFLSSLGSSLLGLLGPIAIVAAALYGVTEILGILMPKEFKELIDRIKKEYKVDEITAHLIAPFEIWKIGILEMIVPAIVDGINALIDGLNAINPLKGITGAIPRINYTKPKDPLDVTGQYLGDNFGPNSPGLAGNQIPRGQQEIITQQKTTNDFAKDAQDNANEMLEQWKNQTNPILAESKDTQKMSFRVLHDTYGVTSAQLTETGKVVDNLGIVAKSIQAIPTMSFGRNTTLGALSGTESLSIALSGRGNPGNLSGSQIVNALHSASGFEGYINQPTGMIVGEAGGEYVSVTPHGKSNQGGTIIINIGGSVWSERELMKTINSRLKSDLFGRNWSNL